MKLDGASPLDREAVRGGKTFHYTFPEGFGPDGKSAHLIVKLKPIGTANVAYQAAVEKLRAERSAVQTVDDLNALFEEGVFQAAFYDHCVVSWSTDLTAENKIIEASRDNFLTLLRFTNIWSEEAEREGRFSPEVWGVMVRVFNDANNLANFYAKKKAEAEKN